MVKPMSSVKSPVAPSATPSSADSTVHASEGPVQNGAAVAETVKDSARNVQIPQGLFLKCPACSAMIYRKAMEENLHCCPDCKHHFRLSAMDRISLIVDAGTFEEMDATLGPVDRLNFTDKKTYAQRILDEQAKTGSRDGLRAGRAFVKGRPMIVAVMDFEFMGGSMGAVVGEKLTRAIERADKENLPLVITSCSGGARMQESTISLMQMAKTAAALARFQHRGGLFISLLADPTYGGVTASFAMLGDVIFAEPKAMIGFAGARTIWNTIKTELPEGFQKAEFLLGKGFIDKIVSRAELRSELARTIDYCGK